VRRAVQAGSPLPVLALCAAAAFCGKQPAGPVPEEIARANARAAALLSQQRAGEAEAELTRALAERPHDPVLLVNLAIARIELGKTEQARPLLLEALELDRDMPHAHYVLGLLEKEAGRFPEAAERFRTVAELDPDDVTTQYQLGTTLARLGRHEEAEAAFRKALETDPTHVPSLYGLGRLLLERGQETEGLRLVEQSQRLRARAGDSRGPADTVGSSYGEKGRYGLAVDYPAGGILPPPAPAAFDFAEIASFRPAAPESGSTPPWTIVPAGAEATPVLVVGGPDGAWGLGRAGSVRLAPAPPGGVDIVALAGGDLDGDGRTDLLVLADRKERAGHELEIRLLAAGKAGFSWAPSPAEEPTSPILSRDGFGRVSAILVDLDHDGDLDLVATWSTGPGALLAINDGTGRLRLEPQQAPRGILPSRPLWSPEALAFSDLDNDRDIDLIAGEGEEVVVWSNRRDGTFARASFPAPSGAAEAGSALLLADLDKDSFMDVLGTDGRTPFVCPNRRGKLGPCRPLGELGGLAAPGDPGGGGLAVLDADNDGFLDVAAGGAEAVFLYRNEGGGRFSRHRLGPGAVVLAALDGDGDGRVDLFVRRKGGEIALLGNRTRTPYRSLALRLRGVRDNRDGIGTKVEILAGALRQKVELVRPVPLHFGLGGRASADAVRILWPGGVLQDELGVQADGERPIAQLDRKGTSCPILYAWKGGRWRFVSDFLGGSAIGYRHGNGELSVPDTDEYVLLEEGLDAEDGWLRVRFNNQLEEVLFFDRVELIVVDHPERTLLYPNERLMPAPPWPPFRLFASADVRALRAAREIPSGRDVTALLLERDRKTADGFRLLPFKGYAEPHTLEISFDPLPSGRRLVLLLDGWIDYADSSSNLAASQAGIRLEPPRLFLARPGGRWQETRALMGFPAGLPKTMSVDLTGHLDPRNPRLRIRTNMRIYWDRARMLVGGEDTPLRIRRLAPAAAELRFGGFPKETSPDGRPPYAYDPDQVDGTCPWKAHRGFYTSFGDVTDLLADTDDRFVVTRSGDEVELRFEAPPAPPAGFHRSYLFYAVGFGKDMDPNSAANDRVGPIPFHGMPHYPYGPEANPPARSLDSVEGGRVVIGSPDGLDGAVPLALLGNP